MDEKPEDIFVAVKDGPFLKSISDNKAAAWYTLLRDLYNLRVGSQPLEVLEAFERAQKDGWDVVRARIVPEASPLQFLSEQADTLKLSTKAVAEEAQVLI